MNARGAPDAASDQVGDGLRRWRPLVERLAWTILRRVPTSVERGELVQAGMIALWQALGRFDAVHGVPFEAFAARRIRGAMLDELRGRDWLTRADRRALRERGGNAPAALVALDELLDVGADPVDASADPVEAVHALRLAERLSEAIDALPPRWRDVVESSDERGVDTAARLGISEARVSQIRTRAVAELRSALDRLIRPAPR